MILSAGTDNQANDTLSTKRSSTKLPLTLVLMQLAELSVERGIRLNLTWRPRAANQEADNLTNLLFDEFDLDKRVPLEWGQLNTPMLDKLLTTLHEYQSEIDARKVLRSGLVSPGLGAVRSTKRKSEAKTW